MQTKGTMTENRKPGRALGTKGKKMLCTFTLYPQTRAALQLYADKNGLSASAALEKAIELIESSTPAP